MAQRMSVDEAWKRTQKRYLSTQAMAASHNMSDFEKKYSSDYLSSWRRSGELSDYYAAIEKQLSSARTLRDYYELYGNDEQKGYISALDEAIGGYSGVLNERSKVEELYGAYSSEGAWKSAVAKSEADIAENNRLQGLNIEELSAQSADLGEQIRTLNQKKIRTIREEGLTQDERTEYDNQIKKLQSQKKNIDSDIEKANKLTRLGELEAVENNEDFELASAFDDSVQSSTYRIINGLSLYDANVREGKRIEEDGWHYDVGQSSEDAIFAEHMTSEEKKRYNALYYDDPAKAKEYLDALDPIIASRAAASAYQYGREHPVLGTLASVYSNATGAVTQFGSMVKFEDVGYNQSANLSTSLRSGVSSEMSPLGSFLYNTGVSAAESLLASMVPYAGEAMLALSSAASTQNDILSRGGTGAQAMIGGLAAGVAEAFFEHVSLSSLRSMQPTEIVSSFKSFMGNVGKEMLTNAGEEAATEFANIMTDTFIMGELSSFNTLADKYAAKGMSETEAMWNAALALAGQIGEAAASGAVMGLGFSSVGGGVGLSQNYAAGQSIINGKNDFFVDDVLNDSQILFNDEAVKAAKDEDAALIKQAKKLSQKVAEKKDSRSPAQAIRVGALAKEVMKEEVKLVMKELNETATRNVAKAAQTAEAEGNMATASGQGAEIRRSSGLPIVRAEGQELSEIFVERDGEVVSLEDVSVEDVDLAVAYSLAVTTGSVEAANAFIDAYASEEEKASPVAFWSAWMGIMTDGQTLRTTEENMQRAFAEYGDQLSQEAKLAAWLAGVELKQAERKRKLEAANSARMARETSESSASEVFMYRKNGSFTEDKYFRTQMAKWERLKHGGYIKVGELSAESPLCQVGMPVGTLRYDVDKLKKNMTDHADYLDVELLKQIPDIIADPVAISEYREGNTISVFGDIFVGDSPMMVGVTVSKDRAGNTISKVRTYNTRRDVGKLITDDTVLYLDKNKKRTRKWFQACGIQVPLGGNTFGFIRSISQFNDGVNTFGEKGKKETSQLIDAKSTNATVNADSVVVPTDSIPHLSENVKGYFDDSALKNVRLDAKQKEFVAFARLFSDVFGVNVTFVASEKGKRKENGSYDRNTNTITLDIFSGIDNNANYNAVQSALSNTLSHEVVHNMSAVSPEYYDALSEYVFEALKSQGMDIEERIQYYIENARAENKKLSREDAIEEIVAHACDGMLRTSETVREFMEGFYDKDSKAANKFSKFVKDVLKRLKSVFDTLLGTKAYSQEARAIYKAGADAVAEIQKLYDEGVLAMREGNVARNYEIESKSDKSEETVKMYQSRETLEQAADEMEKISAEKYLQDKSKYPFIQVMDHTPQKVIDSMEGGKNRRILIRRDALYLAIRENGVQEGHYHGLGAEVIKKLPEYLGSPDVILSTIDKDTGKESKNRRIILTGIDGANGQGIVSVEFESMKDFEGHNDYFNIIITVFDLHKNYLERLFKKQGAIIKEQKESLAQVNPQLYEWLRTINAKLSGNSIPDSAQKVKTYGEKKDTKKEESAQVNSQVQYEGIINANSSNDSISQNDISVKENRKNNSDSSVMKQERITVDMSETERAEILRKAKISPPAIEISENFDVDFKELEKSNWKVVKKPMLEKLRELGFLKSYRSDKIDVEFHFTGEGLRKSTNSQIFEYGGSLADLSKVVMNMQSILDSAVLLEIHSDKAKGTPKENSRLLRTYVLLSAFREGETITPVQFEVKQYVDNDNRLYLAVALTKIETDVISDTAPQKAERTRLVSVSDISIPQLIEKINPYDKNFFKYIPDEFLNKAQLEAKREALSIEAKKYGKKSDKLSQERISTPEPYSGKNLYTDGDIYSYDFMTALAPMVVKTMPSLSSVKKDGKVSQAKAIEVGLKNAEGLGRRVSENQYAVKNVYTGREIVLGKSGLGHSLDASSVHRLRTNARLAAIGGDIVQNAVPINGLKKKNSQANGTYAMACLVNDGNGYVVAIVTVDEFSSKAIGIDFVDIAHSLNGRFLAKKEDSRSSARELESGQKSVSTTAISDISISDFLEIVNSTHKSILSDDVLKHLKEVRPSEGYYSDQVLFQERISTPEPSELLGELFRSKEAYKSYGKYTESLKKYQDLAVRVRNQEKRISEIDAEIGSLRSEKKQSGKGARMDELYRMRRTAEGKIDEYKKRMFAMEARELSAVVAAETDRVRKEVQLAEREKYAKKSKERTEGLIRKETRAKLRRVVKELNRRLNHGTKEKNVKVGMQDVVGSALKAAELLFADDITNADIIEYGFDHLSDNEKKLVDEYKQLLKSRAVLEEELSPQKVVVEIEENSEKYGDVQKDLWINVGSAKNADTNHIYAITNKKEELPTHYGVGSPTEAGNYLQNNPSNVIIPHSSEKVNTSSEKNAIQKKINGIDYRLRKLDEALRDRLEGMRSFYNSAVIDDALDELAAAYSELKNSKDDYIRGAYDELVAERLEGAKAALRGVTVRHMSTEQLRELYSLYKMVLTTVRTSDKLFTEGKNASVADEAATIENELLSDGEPKEKKLKLLQYPESFAWNMLIPAYAFDIIRSHTLRALYKRLVSAEGVWGKDVEEAQKFKVDMDKKYGANKWDTDEQFVFHTPSGKEGSVSLNQIMSIYAYTLRGKQATDHLDRSGFCHSKSIIVKESKWVGLRIKRSYTWNHSAVWRLSPEIREQLISKLSAEQKAYVEEMQKYLSKDCAKKGNEVSRKLYGIEIFGEEFYFPMHSAEQYISEKEKSNPGAVPRLKNSGFTKKISPNSTSPLVLDGFTDVWAKHCADMAAYHAFTLPLEDMARVFNHRRRGTDGAVEGSVQATLSGIYGDAASAYVKRLIDELNGGVRVETTAGFMNKFMSLHKMGATAMSLSTLVQQPTSIFRAMAYINPRYFMTYAQMTPSKHRAEWEEIKKYAPVAILKEMGGYDTGAGAATADYIRSKSYEGFKEKAAALIKDSAYRNNVMYALPSLADELAWCHIWAAVKKEIADTTELTEGSNAFLEACGERFTDVVTHTQVYDSVLARSPLMRSKDPTTKMLTAFSAEPTVVTNMVAYGIIEGKRGNHAFAARIIGSSVATMIANAAVVSLAYAARDDDEDETFTEKYIEALTTELIEGFNPLTYIPFIRDIWSVMLGYDVERTDLSVIADLWRSFEGMFSKRKSMFDKFTDLIGDIAKLFGLPVGNLMREAMAIYNMVKLLIGSFEGETTDGEGIGNALLKAAENAVPLIDKLNS
ncbi:MAG: hypothetical protein IJ002_03175 [Clostridia bacterium]|nr:hypothetical protein [Clostridia bacterium]MBQ8836494.1 hypothetical protein [Clostridia bacterium]